MEQKNGKQQKGLITFCINWGKVLAAIISASIVIGFIIGFVAWATRMSDRSEKIPGIEKQIGDVDKKVGEICTAIDFIGKAQTEQTKRIDQIFTEIKKK